VTLKPSELDLSVVIVTGGLASDSHPLRGCLSSIIASARHAEISFEIIVVDNACAIPLADWLPESFPGVTILRFSPQVGFCRGNNAGFRRSRGRYLLQLNDDTELDPRAIAEVLKVFAVHPDAGAVGPRLVNPDGSMQYGYYARTFPTLIDHIFQLFWINRVFPKNPVLRRHYLLADDPDVFREVDQPAGAALFYRREVLFELGLLDEDYFFAMDDVDICTRIRRAGWRIYYCPTARVAHFGGASLKTQSSILSQSWMNGLLCFYRKNRSMPEFTVFRLLLILALLFRLPIMVAADTFDFVRGGKGRRTPTYLRILGSVLAGMVGPWRPPMWPAHDPQVASEGEVYLAGKEIIR
jgi:N-acetylglucosaminyl-diphospho-decaprenol L-rhamnosyltransferase